MPDAPTSASSFAAPRELLSGIDSLDLTCKVPAPRGLIADLINLKAQAGEDRRQVVPFSVGDAVLRVAATGMGAWWPVRLDHAFGQVGIGESANRPAWRVSLSAEALHVHGVAQAIAFWRGIIETLTGAPVTLMASRLDVHADFAGLDITEDDRPGFVCRSDSWNVQGRGTALQTLYLGRGDVMVRIYDKLAEVQASGKGAYLLGLYGEAGLRQDDTVQRVEAQIRSKPLRQLGVHTAEDAVARVGTVYLYAVDKWLRLTVPGSSTRRERRALDPRWAVVQAANVAAGASAGARVIAERHTPTLDVTVANVAGWALRAAEALGVDELDTLWRQLGLLVGGYLEDKGRDFTAEVRARLLQFGPSAA